MTDPAMRDPVKNFAYYAENTGYENNLSRFHEPRIKRVASWCFERESILDVGCGDGFFAECVMPWTRYEGVELNAKAIENAHPRAKGKITRSNIMDFPYGPRGKWDTIVCMEVLEHVPDPERLLALFHGALEPGTGWLILTTPIGAHAGAEPGNADHLREWTPDELAALLLRCNYAIREGRPEEVYKGRYTACVLASPVKPPPDIIERGAAD